MTDSLRTLEPPTRLSSSVLWELQRRYFETRGQAAWAEGEVPSYATSNPFVAATYARLLEAFLDDCRDLDSDHPLGGLDPTEPLNVIEIGSGSGRLGFLLARELEAHPTFRVVLTDFVPATLDAWAARPELRRLCELGRLDFALFDADHPGPLHLRYSGEILERCANPVAVVANYVVDTLRQDAFAVEGGQLYEIAVQAAVPDHVGDDDLSELVLQRHRRAIDSVGYYDDETLDGLLARYTEALDRSEWLIPVGTVHALREVSRWCGDRVLLLVSDKGYRGLEDLEGRKVGSLAKHGSVSANANLDALGHLAVVRGGCALMPRNRYTELTTAAIVSTGIESELPRLGRAFRDAVDGFGPAEYLRSYKLLSGREPPSTSVPEILLLLRLSRWDSTLFLRFASTLVASASSTNRAVRRDLETCVDEVVARAYPLQSANALLQSGRIRYALGEYDGASAAFRRVIEHQPERRAAWFNLGLSLEQLGRLQDSANAFARALAIDPTYERAREALARVSNEEPL